MASLDWLLLQSSTRALTFVVQPHKPSSDNARHDISLCRQPTLLILDRRCSGIESTLDQRTIDVRSVIDILKYNGSNPSYSTAKASDILVVLLGEIMTFRISMQWYHTQNLIRSNKSEAPFVTSLISLQIRLSYTNSFPLI